MKIVLAAAILAATVSPALAASPWDGTWKLDVSKSHLAGTSWTYTKTPAGLWHFSAGSYGYDFAPDGKPYPMPTTGDTQITTKDGDRAIVFVMKHGDKVLSTTHEEISADGKTLTDHTTGTREDGTKMDDTAVNTRVSGGPGFLGTWKSSKVETNPNSGMVLSTGPGETISWDIPSSKTTVKGKMDGSELAITGPTAPGNITMSIKKASATKLEYWVKLNGKPLSAGTLTLSADGKWLTDTSWTIGMESEKTESVYAKS